MRSPSSSLMKIADNYLIKAAFRVGDGPFYSWDPKVVFTVQKSGKKIGIWKPKWFQFMGVASGTGKEDVKNYGSGFARAVIVNELWDVSSRPTAKIKVIK